MPPNVPSRVLVHTVGQSEQVGYLGSVFQGACIVMEEGDGNRDPAGDDRMKIFVHRLVCLAHKDGMPAPHQALGIQRWAGNMQTCTQIIRMLNRGFPDSTCLDLDSRG